MASINWGNKVYNLRLYFSDIFEIIKKQIIYTIIDKSNVQGQGRLKHL
jgi:hypothetical protein